MPVAATIDIELIEDINRFMDSPLDEFNFRLLLRKTEKLMQANAAYAYMFRGILYSLVWDIKNARSNFSKAEDLAGSDVSLLRNIAVTYARLSFDRESCEYYLRAHKLVRNSEELLVVCVQAALGSNLGHIACEAFDIYLTAGGVRTAAVERLSSDIEVHFERLEALSLSEHIAAEMYELVGEVIRKHKSRDHNARVWFNNEDGISYLVGNIAVDADPKTISIMNRELTEKVIEKFSFEDSEKLIYQFVPVEPELADEDVNKLSVSA